MFVSDKLAIPTLTTLLTDKMRAIRSNAAYDAPRKYGYHRHEEAQTQTSEEYQNFEKLAKQLISVPESEIDKREAAYQKHKKTTKKRKTA